MPSNRAEFQVAVKSSFDHTGTDAAKGAYAALGEQLKQLQSDIANAQRTGVSVPQESLDQISKLENAIAKYGHAAHEGGVETHQVKEALHLVRDAAGDALGPIGELAHFLGNPYVLAAAGAIAAIKMLCDQQEALHENTKRNIEASTEQAEHWRNAFITAANEASDALNNYNIRLAHARDGVDLLAESQRNQTEQARQHAQAIEQAADAQERLVTALIHEQEILGRISSPEANAATQAAHRALRTARENAADEEAQTNIDSRTDQAEAERMTGVHAAARLPAERAAAQHAATMAGGVDIETARANLAKANANLNQAVTNMTAPDIGLMGRAAREGALDPNSNYDLKLKEIQDRELATAKSQATVAQNFLDAQTSKLAQYNQEKSAAEANLSRDTELATAKQLLYESIMREVGQSRERLARTQSNRAGTDRSEDQLALVTRRTALEEKRNNGTLTEAEANELAGMLATDQSSSRDPRTGQPRTPQLNARGQRNTLNQQGADLETAIAQGERALELQRPDDRSPDALTRLQNLFARLLGHQEAGHLTGAAAAAFDALEARLNTLESQVRHAPNT